MKLSGRVYAGELAAITDRAVHTIRQWERLGLLPRGCEAQRDSRNWRYWTPAQVDMICEWLETRAPQSEEKLQKMRRPRDRGVIHTTIRGE